MSTAFGKIFEHIFFFHILFLFCFFIRFFRIICLNEEMSFSQKIENIFENTCFLVNKVLEWKKAKHTFDKKGVRYELRKDYTKTAGDS